MLADKTISEDDKQDIVNHLASAEHFDEDSISSATEQCAEKEVVRTALLNLLQQNTHKAPSPEPASPSYESSPNAAVAIETGAVSHSDPGSKENVQELIVEAACKNIQNEMKQKARN